MRGPSNTKLKPSFKKWKPGTSQVLVFIRNKEGHIHEALSNDASPKVLETATNLVIAIGKS